MEKKRPVESEVQPEEAPVPFESSEDVTEEVSIEGKEVKAVTEEGECCGTVTLPTSFLMAPEVVVLPWEIVEKPEVAPKPKKEELVEKAETEFEFKVGVKGRPGEKLKSAAEVEAEEITTDVVSEVSSVEATEVAEGKEIGEAPKKAKVSGTKMEVAPVKPEVTEIEHVKEKEEAPKGNGVVIGPRMGWLVWVNGCRFHPLF